MITRLYVENFKSFQRFEATWEPFNILVGANNSGKTTIFHAFNFIFWLLEKTARFEGRTVHFEKAQVTEFQSVPCMEPRDIYFQQRIRAGRRPVRIILELGFRRNSAPLAREKKLRFEIYQAYARNFMLDGTGSSKLWRAEYDDLISLEPIYVPGFAGAIAKEDLYRPLAWERLIGEGRHNEVIRNMLYQISQKKTEWQGFIKSLKALFSISGLDVPFNEKKDQWLTATYTETEKVALDIIAAGAGFQQIVQLLAFLYVHNPKTLLLDEPDAHLHHSLQESVLHLLKNVARERKIQIFIATHSPTLIDSAGLSEISVVDKINDGPKRFFVEQDFSVVLRESGIQMLNTKLAEVMRLRRVVFVEGVDSDFKRFLSLFGAKAHNDFSVRCKGLVVLPMEGGTNKSPFKAIDLFEKLVNQELTYLYIRDKDELTSYEVEEMYQHFKKEKRQWRCLERRNRENYLLMPSVLSRVVMEKWASQSRVAKLPRDLTEKGIMAFLLDWCRKAKTETQVWLQTQHEPQLKGDVEHRRNATTRLLTEFNQHYEEPLNAGKIPHYYADGKAMLRALRGHLQDKYEIQFNDEDIIIQCRVDEIPKDLKIIIDEIRDMFPVVSEAPDQLKPHPLLRRSATGVD